MIVRHKKEEVVKSEENLQSIFVPDPLPKEETEHIKHNDLVTIKRSELDSMIESCINKTIREMDNQKRDITLLEFLEYNIDDMTSCKDVGRLGLNAFMNIPKSSILYHELCNIFVDNCVLDDMLRAISSYHEIIITKTFTQKQRNKVKEDTEIVYNFMLEKIGTVLMAYKQNGGWKTE